MTANTSSSVAQGCGGRRRRCVGRSASDGRRKAFPALPASAEDTADVDATEGRRAVDWRIEKDMDPAVPPVSASAAYGCACCLEGGNGEIVELLLPKPTCSRVLSHFTDGKRVRLTLSNKRVPLSRRHCEN